MSAPGQPAPSGHDAELLGPATEAGMLLQLPDVETRHLTALEEAVAATDLDRATSVIRDGWYDLLLGDRTRLGHVLEQLPPGAARGRPLLAMLLGVVYFAHPYRRVKSIRHFLAATAAANDARQDVSPVDRALILVSAGVAYRLVGQPDRAVRAGASAWRQLMQLSDEQRDAVPMMTAIFAQLGMTLYSAGRDHEALDAFEHGLAEAPTAGYRHGFLNVSMLAGIHALRGELPEAEEYLKLAREGDWPDLLRSTYSGTFYRLAEAVIALERFDTGTARDHLAAMIHDRRTIEHWVQIASTEALVDLVDGRPGAAKAGLQAFCALRKGEGRSAATRSRLAPIRALLQLALGNPGAASVILRRDAPAGYAKSISLARVALAHGRHGAALQHLRATSGATMSLRWSAEAVTVEVAALMRFSERPRLQALVGHLGSLLERTHQRVALTLVPDADFQRVGNALADAGFAHVVSGLPPRSWLPDPESAALLSDREFAVLQALVRTPSVARIAADEVVSINTVKTQLKSIYRKLGVSSRDEAIAIALDRHLIVDHDFTDDRGAMG